MSGSIIRSLHKCRPIVLAALVIFVAGCRPSNNYSIELKPRGDSIERTFVFYRPAAEDPKTGITQYQSFDQRDSNELAAITALYLSHSPMNESNRFTIQGQFTKELPNDVGGAGTYKRLTNCLGETGFYVERFRGNSDLAFLSEQRFKAADQLADFVVGWSQMELKQDPDFSALHRFLNVDFRHDLKNLIEYGWQRQLATEYKTNTTEEYGVRFGQYLFEHGYFTLEEIPGLFSLSWDDPQLLLLRIQRLLARKMGVPENQPVPASLSIFADPTNLMQSVVKYLASTDLYHAKLKLWEEVQKLKPETKQPEPEEVLDEAFGYLAANLIEPNLFGDAAHLSVRLSLPSPPVHSNGRWDEALKQVVWDAHIGERTNATTLPFSCYASWSHANEAFQKEHFSKVALTGDELAKYCLWRASLDTQRGGEWDAFLSGLQPGSGLIEKLDAFQFSGESDRARTNSEQAIPSTSDYPREVLKTAVGFTNAMTEAVQRLINHRLTKPN